MNAVGYTSPIVGTEMWDLVNDWYAADEEEEGEGAGCAIGLAYAASFAAAAGLALIILKKRH